MQLESILKKFTYYNIKHKAKRILLKMGENDFYPQLSKSKYSALSDAQRFNFWNYLAKKQTSFKYFYQKNPGDYFDNNPSIEKNNKYYSTLKEFYKNGVAEIINFFNNNDHKLILKFFENNTLNNLDNFEKQNVICFDDNINSIIYEKTKIFEKILFGKPLQCQNYMFQSILKKVEKKSPFGTSALLHSDRFIPSFKLIYFPTAVTVDPFEYALGSHIIDETFKKNILIELEIEKKFGEGEKIKNEILDKVEKERLNLDFGNYELKKFYCKPNTMLIVATHGLHRRSQTKDNNKSGIRNNFTISYYNQFTRYDLLKKIFN